jgi:hypothetical protein
MYEESTMPKNVFEDISKNLSAYLSNAFEPHANIIPKLPDINRKTFVETNPINLCVKNGRESLIEQIYGLAQTNETANLAITAFRDIRGERIKPFVKAAFERNPVSIAQTNGKNINEIYRILKDMPDISIYAEDFRLAQPDEVWNFQRGDGIEKAILLASVIFNGTGTKVKINVKQNNVEIPYEQNVFYFDTNKHVSDLGDDG